MIPVKKRSIIISREQLWPSLPFSINNRNRCASTLENSWFTLEKANSFVPKAEKMSAEVAFENRCVPVLLQANLEKSVCFLGSIVFVACYITAVMFWGIPSGSHNLLMHLAGFDGKEMTRKYGKIRVVLDWHRLYREVVTSPSLGFLKAS